jgi:histidinol-phosphate phosphatase family protein
VDKATVVILDRDGTIIRDTSYLSDPAEVELLPAALEGLKRLCSLGAALLVVTNQSGVGRGFFTMVEVDAVNRQLRDILTAHGIDLMGIFVCTHIPSDLCGCRKPRTGLVESAVLEMGLTLDRAFVIGDRSCDIELGHNLGVKAVWITNVAHQDEIRNSARAPHFAVSNLLEAAEIIAAEIRGD